MSAFLTPLIEEDCGDSRYYKLHEVLDFWSDKFSRHFKAPIGFVNDRESVPIIKGTSNRAGVMHDLVCRKEFDLSQSECADLYFECMESVDIEKYKLDDGKCRQFRRFDKWWRRWVKSSVVRLPLNFYHKFSINATYEEISA